MKITIPGISYPCEFHHGSYSCPPLKVFGQGSERALVRSVKRRLAQSRKAHMRLGIFLPESHYLARSQVVTLAERTARGEPTEDDLAW